MTLPETSRRPRSKGWRSLRPAAETEFAERLGVSDNALQQRLREIASSSFADPQEALDDYESARALRMNLADAVACLPERQQLVLALYYQEGLRMREIGEVLDISESRASKLHAKALVSVRAMVGALSLGSR